MNIFGVFNGFKFRAVGLMPYPSSGNIGEPLFTLLLKEKIQLLTPTVLFSAFGPIPIQCA